MKPLDYTVVRENLCSTRTQKTVRLHFVLVFYSADISKQKDILGVNCSNCTMYQCPGCHAFAQHMKNSSTASGRTLKETRIVINQL